MSFFLRKVDKRRWDRIPRPPWLEADELPAAPLADLNTNTTCRISVYLVDDDESNVLRIVTALAATREKIVAHDYLLIDQDDIAAAGIEVRAEKGRCPDDFVNELHRDLCELTAEKVLFLCKRAFFGARRPKRVEEKLLSRTVPEGVVNGNIQPKRVNPELRKRLNIKTS